MKKALPFLLFFFLIACGGRIPSPSSAQGLTQSYFKSYGHKYKTSLLGKSPVTKVEVNDVRELSRNVAFIDAFLSLQAGETLRVLITTKRTPPLGWSVQSWEIVEQR